MSNYFILNFDIFDNRECQTGDTPSQLINEPLRHRIPCHLGADIFRITFLSSFRLEVALPATASRDFRQSFILKSLGKVGYGVVGSELVVCPVVHVLQFLPHIRVILPYYSKLWNGFKRTATA